MILDLKNSADRSRQLESTPKPSPRHADQAQLERPGHPHVSPRREQGVRPRLTAAGWFAPVRAAAAAVPSRFWRQVRRAVSSSRSSKVCAGRVPPLSAAPAHPLRQPASARRSRRARARSDVPTRRDLTGEPRRAVRHEARGHHLTGAHGPCEEARGQGHAGAWRLLSLLVLVLLVVVLALLQLLRWSRLQRLWLRLLRLLPLPPLITRLCCRSAVVSGERKDRVGRRGRRAAGARGQGAEGDAGPRDQRGGYHGDQRDERQLRRAGLAEPVGGARAAALTLALLARPLQRRHTAGR